jgi:hypothetical protein
MKRKLALAAPRPIWQSYALIFAAVILLYGRTLFFNYVFLDDNALILNQQEFLRHAANILAAFRTDVFHGTQGQGAYYRPLLTVSFMFDVWWGGIRPLAFHLTNVLSHAGASCLLFLLLSRLGARRGPALFCALAFAVHPALT